MAHQPKRIVSPAIHSAGSIKSLSVDIMLVFNGEEGSQHRSVCSPEYQDPRRGRTSSTQSSCHGVSTTPRTTADHTEAPLPNPETDSRQSDPHLLIGNEISHESFLCVPPPGSSDAYAQTGPPWPTADGFSHESLLCVPPPGSSDAYAQTGPPWPTADGFSHESLLCVPPPGSSDAYARTGPPWPTGDAILHELFPCDAPPPGSTDYANEIEPTHILTATTTNMATRQRNNCPVDGSASTSVQAPVLQPAYQFSLQDAGDPRISLNMTWNDQTQSSHVRGDTSSSALHCSQSSFPFERARQGQLHGRTLVV